MLDRPAAAREALESLKRRDPEQPFLFFRSPRGTFTWWSFARAAAALDSLPDCAPLERIAAGNDDSRIPFELLETLASAGTEELARANELMAAVARPEEREIWISARRLERVEERSLALAGALAAWAIVREPGEALTPALLLWARPTLISGTEEEIVTLMRGVAGEAPRWRRSRTTQRRLSSWLSPRLARLRTILVEGGGSGVAIEREVAALALRTAAPRVLPFPGGGW